MNPDDLPLNYFDKAYKDIMKNNLDTYGLKMKEFIVVSEGEDNNKAKIVDQNEIKNCVSLINDYIIYENLEEACKLINKYTDILRYPNDGKLNILSQLVIMINSDKDKKQLIKVIKKCSDILNDESLMINKIKDIN